MKKTHSPKRLIHLLFLGISLLVLTNCAAEKQEIKPDSKLDQIVEKEAEPIPPPPVSYHLIATKDTIEWLRALQPGDTLDAILVINRVDKNYLLRLDTLVMPDSIGVGTDAYSPFPKKVAELERIHKMMFVSHFAQAFAIYENGERIKWGPVNLGTKWNPTPSGLFATNWKSKRTISTVNSAWILDWYFNFDNFEGVAFHEYALPGFPASHACARMYREDAKWIYHWADQWVIEDSKIAVHGTPLVVFGEYPYGERKPWFLQAENKLALEITPSALMDEMRDFLPTIMERQAKRDAFNKSLEAEITERGTV